MEFVAVERSPCDQHCLRAASSTDSAILTVSSSSCSETYDDHHRTIVPWLSVVVTADCEVVIQMPPSSSHHDPNFSSILAASHGVKAMKSTPNFARFSCANIRATRGLHSHYLSLPVTAENVLASDVSTRSTIAFVPPVPKRTAMAMAASRSPSPAKSNSRLPAHAAMCCTGFPSKSPAHQRAGKENVQLSPSTSAVRDARETLNGSAGEDALSLVVDAARALPTIVLLIRSSLSAEGRALLLLRPAVENAARRCCGLVYTSAMWPVSESVRRVALTPNGDRLFALSDRFARLAVPVDPTAKVEAEGGETHVVLHGSYLNITDGAEVCPSLRGLVCHVGLCGSSSSQRHALRSLLRGGISGVWCRWCGTTSNAPQEEAYRGATEVAMYSTEGHVLVFQPLLQEAAQRSAVGDKGDTGSFTQYREIALYACCYGTRLTYSQLSGSAWTSTASHAASNTSLLVSPPWRFLDQWCHSVWFRGALERDLSSSAVASADHGEVQLQPQSQRRHRHRPSTVLATSANRRVWLVRAGAHLSLITVPSAAFRDEDSAQCFSPAIVKVGPREALHDVQFVHSDGHSGFLLLCRCNGGGGGDDGDGGDAEVRGDDDGDVVLAGASYSLEGRRYIHGRPTCLIRVFFLSLFALHAPGAGSSMSASLLSLPLQLHGGLRSAMAPLLHPSHRLRFVCAYTPSGTSFSPSASVADVVALAFTSSGSPRQVWTAAANVPSLILWCSAHLLQRVFIARRPCTWRVGASLSLPAVVQQWVAHALSAAWPCALLTEDRRRVEGLCAQLHDASSSSPTSAAGSVFVPPADMSVEAVVEDALLHLDHPRDLYRNGHEGQAMDAVRDALRCPLTSFLGVVRAHSDGGAVECAGQGVACVVAVFAGFSTALCVSGLVGCADIGKSRGTVSSQPHATDMEMQRPATMRALTLLYSSARVLLHALEDLCAVGQVSALLACVSHLTRTLPPPAPYREDAVNEPPAPAVCTTRVMWALLLQPLFDLVWVVLRDCGAASSVAQDLLMYCSPAVRAMARAGSIAWSTNQQDGSSIATAPAMNSVAASAVNEAPVAGGEATGRLKDTQSPLTPQRVAAPSPPAASLPAPTHTYTSAELYEVVRRVFLLQGAAAALRLVHQLRQHESTREGVAEMAQMYEAMQQRLDQISAT